MVKDTEAPKTKKKPYQPEKRGAFRIDGNCSHNQVTYTTTQDVIRMQDLRSPI